MRDESATRGSAHINVTLDCYWCGSMVRLIFVARGVSSRGMVKWQSTATITLEECD